MIEPTRTRTEVLDPWLRCGLIVASLALLVLLLTAARLSPDPRGFGTHEQLGLRACTFLITFGHRCPSCGMTTAWTQLLHGYPIKAIQAHTTGTLLAALAVIGTPWIIGSALRGRWIVWQPRESVVLWTTVALTGSITIEWAIRILSQGGWYSP